MEIRLRSLECRDDWPAVERTNCDKMQGTIPEDKTLIFIITIIQTNATNIHTYKSHFRYVNPFLNRQTTA